MNALKWECDALESNDGIFLMHTGRSLAANPIYHNFIMVAYIAYGNGIHKCGDKNIEIGEGDIFIVNPNFIHCLVTSENTQFLEVYYCFFSVDKAKKIWAELRNDFPEFEGFFDNTSLKYLHTKDNSNKEIRSMFVRIIDEFMHCPPGYKSLVNNYIQIIVAQILRRCRRSINNPIFNGNKIVDEIIRYINYNLNFGVKVIDIAEALHLSEEHLCRLFKKHTGVTIKQFITNLKIEKIKDYLKNTDRSIESISVSLNCNQIYLNRLFKKHTGMTLLAYRKKYHYKT